MTAGGDPNVPVAGAKPLVPPLETSVHNALSAPRTSDFALHYVGVIRDNYEAAELSARRASIAVVTFAFAFQLLVVAAIKDVNLGPVTLRDLGAIEKVLPVLIAYFMYTGTVFGVMRGFYQRAHRAFLAELDPTIIENGLDRILRPPTVFLFGTPILRSGSDHPVERNYFRVTRILALATGYGALIFEGYAFYRLFTTYGADDWGTWIALAGTLVFLSLWRWLEVGYALYAVWRPSRDKTASEKERD